MVWPDATLHWLAGRWQAISDEFGKPVKVVGVNIDITERKQAEEALRNREYLLRNVLDTNPNIIFVKDRDSRILLGNEALARFYGTSLEQLVGRLHTDIHARLGVSPEDITQWLADDRAAIDTGVTQVVEDHGTRKDGSARWFHTTKLQISLPDGNRGVLVVSEDVTERKHAEKALRRSEEKYRGLAEALEKEYRTLRHLLQSSDHERQLIAYEIHDELAQQLAGAIMQCQTFMHLKDTRPGDAAKAFDAGMTMLRQGHTEARRLISGVRPPILDEEGVIPAITHVVNEERRRRGPKIEFRSDVEFDRLAPILENAIYRIVQEGLTNACRYSKSERVQVSLVQHGDSLQITVQDWGVGFDAGAVDENHFGLSGIRERARLLGGRSTVQTASGKGTCITVEVPVVAKE